MERWTCSLVKHLGDPRPSVHGWVYSQWIFKRTLHLSIIWLYALIRGVTQHWQDSELRKWVTVWDRLALREELTHALCAEFVLTVSMVWMVWSGWGMARRRWQVIETLASCELRDSDGIQQQSQTQLWEPITVCVSAFAACGYLHLLENG